MNTKKHFTTKKIVMASLLAALTVAGSSLRIKVPVDFVGTSAFHLGNILCALSGILLGPWLGGLAAGLGSAIYDMLDPMYISECWLTFLLKGTYGLVAGLIAHAGHREWRYAKALLGTIAGAVTYAILYLAKSWLTTILVGGVSPYAALIAALSGKLLATTFNAVIAIVGAPLLAVAIRKALKANHLSLE